uniref:hypothetical protein n=1 Tax=Thiolapillus sp. TaxID=2017437 RepID=UPI003AF4176A
KEREREKKKKAQAGNKWSSRGKKATTTIKYNLSLLSSVKKSHQSLLIHTIDCVVIILPERRRGRGETERETEKGKEGRVS